MSSSLSPAGRLFAIAAFAEGLTWARLLVGMLLKYGTQTKDKGSGSFFGAIQQTLYAQYAHACTDHPHCSANCIHVSGDFPQRAWCALNAAGQDQRPHPDAS